MPYQIEKTYTSFWGGISDDDFLGTENAVKDLDWIDVQTQERYAQAQEAYTKSSEYDFYGWAPTWVKSTPYWVFRWNISETLSAAGTQLSGTIGTTIDIMESYWSWTDQVNYFFHRTAGIKVTDYLGTTLTTTISTNYPSGETSAVWWHVTNLLFSKDNAIYFVDTVNNYINVTTLSATVGATNWSATITTNDTTWWTRWAIITWTWVPASTTIVSIINNTSAVISNNFTWTTGNAPVKIGNTVWATYFTPWTKVKYIYSYSFDSTIVVATNGYATYIYELEFTGWGYNIVSKMEEKSYKCIDAVGNAYDLYWISTDWIHQYQWRQSQFIKKVPLAIDSKIGFNKWPLVASSWYIYRLSSTKPWRNKILTRYDTVNNIYDVDLAIVLVQWAWSKSAYLVQGSAYKRTNTIELLPLDWGSFQIPKQDLNFRFGYMFARWSYTNSATKQEIVVKIQTDGIEMINSSTFVEVARVTDGDTLDTLWNKKYGYMEINPDMVVTALETAVYSTEFNYVKVKIELLAGDEYASPAWFYRKTPKLFDFTCKANFTKNV